MAKSGNTTKIPQTGGGSNKGDGGRRPPANPQAPIQKPKEDRSGQGDPGIKPPKGS